ncbi:MAG: hypothetical protein ACOX4H_02690 [Bacillota bacterium]|jgi:hypothetical protein
MNKKKTKRISEDKKIEKLGREYNIYMMKQNYGIRNNLLVK